MPPYVTSPDLVWRTDIQNYLDPHVSTVKESDSLDSIIGKIKGGNSRYPIYIVDEDRTLKGVITASDLTKLALEDGKPATAGQLGTTENVIGVRKGAQLWQLVKIMNGENKVKRRFDYMPVVDTENHLVGVVGRDALRSALSEVRVPVSYMSTGASGVAPTVGY